MTRYRVPISEPDRIRSSLVLQLVSVRTGVGMVEATDRLDLAASRARRLAMYLSHTGYGWPLERVGHAFGLNRSTASMACRWAEDQREHPAIDRMLDQIDAMLREVETAETIDLAVAS